MYRRDMVEIQDLTRLGEPSSEYQFFIPIIDFFGHFIFLSWCEDQTTDQSKTWYAECPKVVHQRGIKYSNSVPLLFSHQCPNTDGVRILGWPTLLRIGGADFFSIVRLLILYAESFITKR